MSKTDRKHLTANIADLRAQIETETNPAARRCLEGTLAEMERRLSR